MNLGDHLVAAPGDVETVHKVAPHQGGQIAAHLLEIKPHVRRFVTVDNDLSLRLVYLHVDNRRKSEHSALYGFELQLLRKAQDFIRFFCRGQDEFYRELTAAGQSRRSHRKHLDAGNLRKPLLGLRQDLEYIALTVLPGFGHHTAETGCR